MEDSTYNELLEYLTNGNTPSDVPKETYQQWAQQFEKKIHHIYVGNKRVIPRREVNWICNMFHDHPTMAHQSKDAMFQLIKQRYIWEGMYKDIANYVKTCWECQRRGTARQNNPKSTISPGDIFERWGIDIVGPLLASENGNRYIIVAVDYFSRWPEARAVKNANAVNVADFIYEEIICRFGIPKVIQSDQGTHFVNSMIKELTEKFRIRHSLSSPYHPQSNGLVERFNKTLCEGLAKVGETIHDWDRYLAPVLFAYRIKTLRISGTSPYKVVYGKEPILPGDSEGVAQGMVERLLEITEKVPQLRQSARRAIKEA